MFTYLQKLSRTQKIVLLSISIGLLFVGLALLMVKRMNASVELQPPSQPPPSQTDASAVVDDRDSFGVLLLGYGGAGHQGGFLTDVMLLVHFDLVQETLALISIPRDLWVTFPNGNQGKINAAFGNALNQKEYPTEDLEGASARMGADITKTLTSQIIGLPADFFVGIDFQGTEQAIDELGGVTVDVPVAFEDPWYPVRGRELEPCGHTPEEIAELSARLSGFELEKQFPCRYEHLTFPQGQVEMSGATALKFARSRHGSHGGDFARSQRQQALLLGVRDKLLSLDALQNIPAFFERITKAITTDVEAAMLVSIAPRLRSIDTFRVVTISLNDSNVLTNSRSSGGAFILLPRAGQDNWDETQAFIQKEIREQTSQAAE